MALASLVGVLMSQAVIAAAPSVNPLADRMTEGYVEPAVPGAAPSSLWGLALLMLMTVIVLVVSLIPSKRGHQD